MCLFQRTGKQRQAPVRSEVEPFLAARSGDSREVAEQQAAASRCWVGCGRREGVTPPGRRPSGQMAWERPPRCLWPLDGGCGLKGWRVFSEGGPAKAGVCEGPSRALRIREMLDLLPLTLLELASGATASCSCLAPVGENEGKPRTPERGPKPVPGVPPKAGLAGAALRAFSAATAGPEGAGK